MSLKLRLQDEMKTAMKGGDKLRLGVIRLINTAIKQREVDERVTLDDAAIVAIVEKMIKQRRDSVSQYTSGGRPELAEAEQVEIGVLEVYLPPRLDEAALDAIITECIAASGASSAKDMGKVMAMVKPKVQGQADMSVVSARIKTFLG